MIREIRGHFFISVPSYSHSMVPGGLVVRSSTRPDTPGSARIGSRISSTSACGQRGRPRRHAALGEHRAQDDQLLAAAVDRERQHHGRELPDRAHQAVALDARASRSRPPRAADRDARASSPAARGSRVPGCRGRTGRARSDSRPEPGRRSAPRSTAASRAARRPVSMTGCSYVRRSALTPTERTGSSRPWRPVPRSCSSMSGCDPLRIVAGRHAAVRAEQPHAKPGARERMTPHE